MDTILMTLSVKTIIDLALLLSDKNECVTGEHTCDKRLNFSTCTNTNGSFTCECNKGFEGNGHICKGATI